MSKLEKYALEPDDWVVSGDDLNTLKARATEAWEAGRHLCEIHVLDLLRLVKACEALATVKVDRDLWKQQVEAAQRERDEARAALAAIVDKDPYLNCVCGRGKPRMSESARDAANKALGRKP